MANQDMSNNFTIGNINDSARVGNSGMMHSIFYDREAKLLFIRFHSNQQYIYRYHNVPKVIEDYIEPIKQKKISAGGFFHKYIKGKYKFEKIPFVDFEKDILGALEEKEPEVPIFQLLGKL